MVAAAQCKVLRPAYAHFQQGGGESLPAMGTHRVHVIDVPRAFFELLERDPRRVDIFSARYPGAH